MPLTAAAATALSAALSAGGQGATGLTSAIMGKRSFQRNRRQYKRELEYNHPAQQIARLKEAGLSPKLIYGMGSGQASGQSSVSSPRHEKAKAPNFDFGVTAKMLAHANIAKTRAETKLVNDQRSKVRAEATLLETDVVSRTDDNASSYQEYVQNKRILKKLEVELQSGTQKAKIDQAVRTAKLLSARLTGVHLDNFIKKYEKDLIEKFGMSKSFVAIVISKILSK